jgi:hypothetical protein
LDIEHSIFDISFGVMPIGRSALPGFILPTGIQSGFSRRLVSTWLQPGVGAASRTGVPPSWFKKDPGKNAHATDFLTHPAREAGDG